MYHICFSKQLKIANLERVRLYSSCLIVNKINNVHKNYNTNRLTDKITQNRYFSLQSTIDSIIRTQTGIFKFLSESTPVAYAQDFVLTVHSNTGLPWWASIILTTIFIRSCVTVPLAIYQNYILAKLENLQLEMPGIVEELKKETALAIHQFNWDERTAKFMFRRSLKKQWNNLIVRDNCHPFKASLLIWVQLPMWVCLSISFRNLVYMLPKGDIDAQITFTELTVGGFGWIPNLIVPDTSFILPVTLGIVNLLIIEIQTASKTRPSSKLQRYATNFFRGFSIFMIPIAASVPSCLAIYWTSSSVYGLFQNLILMSPKVKRFVGIPKTNTEIQEPYSNVFNKLKNRFTFNKNVENTG